MTITGIDGLLLAVVGISAAIGLYRGFIREILSLAGWMVSFWLAITYAREISASFESVITQPNVRLGASFILLFLTGVVVVWIFNAFFSKFITLSFMGVMDRVMGFAFGVLRGAIVASVLVFVVSLTPVEAEPAWQDSTMVAYFQDVAEWAREQIDNGLEKGLEKGMAEDFPDEKLDNIPESFDDRIGGSQNQD
ncbi:MAG: CvpA family protein [Gammaproteobacteria bacterium]